MRSQNTRAAIVVSAIVFGTWPVFGQSTATTEARTDNQKRVCERLLELAKTNPRLNLVQSEHRPSGTTFVQGTYTVFENRDTSEGRQLGLAVAVLPAKGDARQPDPVFVLHGGPGAAATGLLRRNLNSWIRNQRDIVFIDQRGTGRSNALHVPQIGNDDNLQTYFESMFQPEVYKAELPRLQKIADLTQYTTPIAVDDFNEVRKALGYDKINLRGGSYGTRSALIYMRRHPETIRTATLQAVAPLSYRNPLPHASEAQQVLDRLFDECQSTPEYCEAFGDLKAKFNETLARLQARPATVTVRHPVSGADVEITMDRNAFAECLRVLMYTVPTNRQIPSLLLAAHAGEYRRIAEAGLANNRGVRKILAFGMLMCVTATEDIARIDPGEIQDACADTFLGTARVASQMSVAAIWPKGKLPDNFADPVKVDVPTLLLSGSHDPTTSARWGEEAAGNLPNSLHVIAPGAHGVAGRAISALERAFLESGSVEGLDTSATKKMRMPPLVLPRERN